MKVAQSDHVHVDGLDAECERDIVEQNSNTERDQSTKETNSGRGGDTAGGGDGG